MRVSHIFHITMVGIEMITILIHYIYRRIFLMKPQWSRTGRYVEYHTYSSFSKAVHHHIKPFEIIHPFLRFIAVPCKMSQTHTCKSGFLHEPDIILDLGQVLVIMRMIIRPDIKLPVNSHRNKRKEKGQYLFHSVMRLNSAYPILVLFSVFANAFNLT